MHKSDFFHFLHKRENPSFLAFGQNARVLPAAAFCFHIYYVFDDKCFRFLNVFVVFRCQYAAYLVKVLTPSFLYATFIYIRAGFVLVLLGHALHRQGDALLGGVHIQHLDPHNVADLEHLARVLDKFIADL